jgi:hypothetical protein
MGEGFFYEVGWTKNAVKLRAIDCTDVENKILFRPKTGRDRLFGHICLTLSLVFVKHKNFIMTILFCSVHSKIYLACTFLFITSLFNVNFIS